MALELCFETLLCARPLLQGDGYGGDRSEHVLGPPQALLRGSNKFPVRCPGHGNIGDYVGDFSDGFHAEVSSIFSELPEISFSILVGVY